MGIERRRRDKARKKKAARALYAGCRVPEKYADHLAVCSCYGCGNPRHHSKGKERLTVQELREILLARALEELE